MTTESPLVDRVKKALDDAGLTDTAAALADNLIKTVTDFAKSGAGRHLDDIAARVEDSLEFGGPVGEVPLDGPFDSAVLADAVAKESKEVEPDAPDAPDTVKARFVPGPQRMFQITRIVGDVFNVQAHTYRAEDSMIHFTAYGDRYEHPDAYFPEEVLVYSMQAAHAASVREVVQAPAPAADGGAE